MKKAKFLLPCAICAVVIMLVASCSKDGTKGDTGPAGPAGPAGSAGAAGAAGPAGTANVIYSAWLDVTFEADTFRATGNVLDTAGWFASITAAKLDQSILNTGEVRVYLNANVPATPFVVPLPYTDLYRSFGVLTINPSFFLNTISLYADQDASTFTVASGASAGQKAWQYRYILIPGGTTARMAKTVDWNDYNAVKKYLGLKD